MPFKELRRNEIEMLKSIIKRPSNSRRIIYIQGQPGLGKSVLSEFIRSEISNGLCVAEDGNYIRYAELDFKNISPDSENEYEVVNQLYKQMCQWDGMEFANYELARVSLYLQSGKTIPKYEIVQHNSVFSKIAQEFAVSVLDFIGGKASGGLKKELASVALSAVLKGLVGDTIQDIYNDLESRICTLFSQGKKQLSEFVQQFDREFAARKSDEKESLLTKYFIKDLEESESYCTAHKVVFLDTFEKVSINQTHWIYQTILKSKANILWIILGTDPYAFNEEVHSNLQRSLQPCCWGNDENKWPLKELSDENSEKLLELRGVPKGILREKMVRISNGLPGALSLLADTYSNMREENPDLEPNIYDFEVNSVANSLYANLMQTIYMRHINEPQRLAYGFLAELDLWDRDVFFAYAVKENIAYPGQLFEKLTRQSISQYISDQGERTRWSLLDVPKSVFQKNSTKKEKQRNHKIAYEYYREECERRLKEYSERDYSWSTDEYEDFQKICINAVHYGVLQYQDRNSFTDFCLWFINNGAIESGFQQRISNYYRLYSLKETLLKIYISEVTKKDNFQYDIEQKFQMQAYYDLAWAYIHLHKYEEAIEKIMFKLSKGMMLYRAITHEENIKCVYSIGVIYQRWGEYGEAKFWHKIALDHYEKNYNRFSDAKGKAKLSASINAYADVLMNLREFEESQIIYQDALKMHGLQTDENGQYYATDKNPLSGIRALGNYSKLFYLWAMDKMDSKILDKAERCIKECIRLYENSQLNEVIQRKSESTVRLLTIEFQRKRFFKKEIAYTDEYDYFVNAYQKYINRWEGMPNYAKDYLHNILNTRHNLSVAYAYAGRIEDAKAELEYCIKERSVYQSDFITTVDKNLVMAYKNMEMLKSANPQLEKLQAIY